MIEHDVVDAPLILEKHQLCHHVGGLDPAIQETSPVLSLLSQGAFRSVFKHLSKRFGVVHRILLMNESQESQESHVF